MDRKAIEARIAQLRGELATVEGTPTEVYSRIVGYYRSVRNWNAGKREEYGQRLVFKFPEAAAMAPRPDAPETARPAASEEARPAAVSAPEGASLRDGILVFTKEHCPNCPPVKNFVVSSGIKAVFVDAEAEEGLALARDHGIMATPTVLGIDAEGRESFRAFDVKSLRERLGSAGTAAGIAAAPRQSGASPSVKL
jgi:ribonucleoside-triphosphate reductase